MQEVRGVLPPKSIPMGAPDGTLRWKLNDETCFEYFRKCGTDCGVCMRVCPWGHASSLPHKLIRFMIARNAFARRLFFWMDDIFYGRKTNRLRDLFEARMSVIGSNVEIVIFRNQKKIKKHVELANSE